MIYRSPIPASEPWSLDIDLRRDLAFLMEASLKRRGIQTGQRDPVYEYFNYMKRTITIRPRRIVRSEEFHVPPEYGKAQDRMVLRFLHPALFAVGFLPSLQIRSPTRISYPIKSSRHPYTIRSHEPWPYHHHQNTLYRQISQQNKPPA